MKRDLLEPAAAPALKMAAAPATVMPLEIRAAEDALIYLDGTVRREVGICPTPQAAMAKADAAMERLRERGGAPLRDAAEGRKLCIAVAGWMLYCAALAARPGLEKAK